MRKNSKLSSSTWTTTVLNEVQKFAHFHRTVLGMSTRQNEALFEVGCFFSLLHFYQNQGYRVNLENLKSNEYRYLTKPAGDPKNFSYVTIAGPNGKFEIRQQIRIQSHVESEIRFSPDIAVMHCGAIHRIRDAAFANGERDLCFVESTSVVAAHECKSMKPFPEMMVGFLGMLIAGHSWIETGNEVAKGPRGHLAPTLFVGGLASALNDKMIGAMQSQFMLNVVVGIHAGTWSLDGAPNRLLWQGVIPVLVDSPPKAAKARNISRAKRRVIFKF